MKTFTRRSFLTTFAAVPAMAAIGGSMPAILKPYAGRKINIALVGLGRYAALLAEGLEKTEYCKLAGLVTGTPSKATEWSKKYNIPQANIYNYQNFDQVASNKDIDLIYIVLPNAMHKEFTLRAAKAGKHVIVEKPMATNAADCLEMIDACKKAGVHLAVGYRLHYEPYNLEIKRLGQDKVFGPVRYIETSLAYTTGDPNEWRLNKALAGGGPLMNIGIYCVQAARYVTGEEPVSVTAQFGPVTNAELFKQVEASVTWQLQFPGGTVSTSTTAYNCSLDRFYATAEKGFFELSPGISYGPFKGRTSNGELHFPVINQQAAQMDGICKVILDNKTLPDHITGAEGYKDLKVMEAIYEAARTGRRVNI